MNNKIINRLLAFVSFTVILIATAYAATGGPDTYGYTWEDSNGATTYSWISHTGSATTVGSRTDDSMHGSYSIGFTFNFYGTDYTDFYVCNNGYITFTSGTCAYSNADIITAAVPNNYIAPFWDDMFTGGTIKYELFGSSPNRYLVVSYEGINHVNHQAGDATYQVIIYETTNNIKFQYSDVTFGNATYDDGASATVGIENSDGTDGLKFSFDSASLSSSFAVEYDWPTPSLSITQSAYRFFEGNDSTDVGSALAAADTAATLSTSNQQFRLRTLLHVGGVNLSQSAGSYKLQFVGKGDGTCSAPTNGTPSSWTDVTTSTAIAFYDNTTPTDASALTANGSDPTNGANTIVNQTYEEANNFSNTQAAINAGQDGKWDFSLYDKTATEGTTYCFRIVESDATVLDTYTVYPEITTPSTSGGPDTYGYSWNTSAGSGEAYSWNDISGTGTEVTGRTDDGMHGPYNIGFTFSFYGNNKTQFYVCNNGFVSFSGDTCPYTNVTIITAATPNDYIAPFWDDMFTGGNVYYETTGTAPNRKLIVSFDGINPYSTQANNLSYQVVLHETTGRIKLQYKDVDSGTATYGGGIGATVGIENSNGTDGLLFSFNEASLTDNLAIDFTYDSSATYTQSAYRLFANNDGVSVGSALAAQDIAYSLTSDGQEFRLRMLIQNNGASSLSTNGENFKLQYVDKGAGTCSSPSGSSPASWTDITTSTALAYKDNTTPTDGSALTSDAGDPTDGGNTVRDQTYEEANDFTNSQAAIGVSENGLWDFALHDNSVSGARTLCIRAVTSGDSEFATYTSYPEVTTMAGADSLTLTLSNNSAAFGLITSTVSTAAATTITVNSTATNGFQVQVKGEGNGSTAGLYNSGHTTLIPATASSGVVTSGAAGFGIYFENASAGITIDEGFDNDSTADLAVSRTYQNAFSTSSATGGAVTADLRYTAVIDDSVGAGSYSETIEVIVYGLF